MCKKQGEKKANLPSEAGGQNFIEQHLCKGESFEGPSEDWPRKKVDRLTF